MIHCNLICLIIFLLANVQQSFASCNEKVLEHRINVILQHPGWIQITHVQGKTEICDDEHYTFSSADLYFPIKYQILALYKYDMVVNLLGCVYIDALLEYLLLIEDYIIYCGNTVQSHLNNRNDSGMETLVSNHNILLNMLLDWSELFDQMYSAIDYIKELNPAVESDTKAWNVLISNFINFSHTHYESWQSFIVTAKVINDTLTAISQQNVIFEFVTINKKTLREFVVKKCILNDDKDKLIYPSNDPEEILQLIPVQLNELRNVVISKYYGELGFIYTMFKTTYVMLILTQWPYSLDTSKKLLAARMFTLILSSNGWNIITNVRGKLETDVDINDEYNSHDLAELTLKNQIPTEEENAEEIYLKAATLLGCKYMDVLLKYLNLFWQNLMYCQSIGNENPLEKSTIYDRLLQCYMFALNQAKDSLPMFGYLHSALRCFEELYLTYEEYVKEFRDQVVRLSDFSQSLDDTYLSKELTDESGKVQVNTIIKDIKSISYFYNDTIVIIKGLAHVRCELLDNNFKTYELFQIDFKNAYPDLSIETLTYIKLQMNKLRKDAIQFFFHELGFLYDETMNKAIVPVFHGELHDTNQNIQ